MPKMFLVLMILLLTNNICNAAIYKNIENDFLIDIGDNWNLSDKSTQEGGMVLIFTASDDKKSTVRVGVSPVIDEKENATLRNMLKELLNEYFDAFIGMTKQASSKYNITFADCKNIGPHYVLLVNASLPMEIYKKDIFIYDGFLGYGRNTSAATHNNNQIAAASMIAPENIL